MSDTSQRILAAVVAASEIYAKELSQPAIKIWIATLGGLPIEAVEHAFAAHFKDPDAGRYMPKPADVIRRVRGISDDVALRAWTRYLEGLKDGWARALIFDDPVLHRVVGDMGGSLRRMTAFEEPQLRREFERRYIGYLERGEDFEYPRSLMGAAAESPREGSGIRFVGNEERARNVLAGIAPALPLLETHTATTKPLLAADATSHS
jgi:hypothetical protein